MIPLQVFSMALVGIIWTRLMERLAQTGSDDSIRKMLFFASDAFGASLIFSILCFFYSKNIIYILFFRGKFDLVSLEQTSLIFQYMILGLPFVILYTFQTKMLLSLERSKIIGISGLILTATLFITSWYAYQSKNIIWVPLSQLTSYSIAAGYNFLMLRSISNKKTIKYFLFEVKYFLVYAIALLILLAQIHSQGLINSYITSKFSSLLFTTISFTLVLIWPGYTLFRK